MDTWKLSKAGFCDCALEIDNTDGDYVMIDDVIYWLRDNGHEKAYKDLKEHLGDK